MATRKTASPSSSRTRSPYTTPASSAVDAQLERYRSMRNFDITAEPSGNGRTSTTFALRKPTITRGLPFVIQKHEASHLHYDFRLSWGGVLKSWAVAKGPSYNPQDRRLAVEVEDHPLEYGGFEGIIPQGQYGGGTVMIWDQGTWWPQLGSENVDACLRGGHLKFEMNGSKMKGKWALIRMNHPIGKSSPDAHPNWLLIKEHDKFEHDPTDPPITDQRPNSSITGRSIKQIAVAHDHVWDSSNHHPNHHADPDHSPSKAPAPTPAAKKSHPRRIPAKLLDTLPHERQPAFISPQLALEATAVPTAGDWLHELKLDGYRIQARKSAHGVQLLTRTGIDWTHRMPSIAAAIAHLPVTDCTLDGEVIVLAPDGTSSFALLQASFQHTEDHPLTYFLFDLLHIDGRNTRDLTLRERKQLLAHLIPASEPDTDAGDEPLRLSEDIPGNGETVFHHACRLHAEGILSKRANAPYRSSRSTDWLKSKCLREQELVIAGFTLSSEGPDRIGSLLLGYYNQSSEPGDKSGAPGPDFGTRVSRTPKQTLIYAGRTGTGFSQQARRDLLTQLVKLRIPEPAFAEVPHDATRGAFWVRPVLVAQVRFATWTADHLVRQAAFLGLREDKPATEVTRESATVPPKPKSKPTPAKSPKTKHAKPRAQASHRTETLQKFTLAAAKPKSASKPKPTKATLPAPKPTKLKSAPAKSVPSPPQPTLAVRAGLRLTHPDKILDPTSGLTKQQLADYYATVADLMLPHIADRPLSLVRCPNGTTKPCFFQKHVGPSLPPGINTIDIADKTSTDPQPYITLNTPDAIIALAQMNALEVHPWGSTNSNLDHPDRLILDLDPDATLPWSTLAAAAAEVRQRLKDAGLESFLKLTGGKGLHIVAPIQPTLTWDELKAAAHALVLSMERNNPALYLTKMTKSSRTNKIFLDYLRNQRGATAVAPYSPRARAGAHVSLPLPWSALKEEALPTFSIHDLDTWRNRLRTNPWKTLPTTHQQLNPKQFLHL